MSAIYTVDPQLAKALKFYYSNKEVDLTIRRNVLLGLLSEKDGIGQPYQHNMVVDNGTGVSSDFATAQNDNGVRTRLNIQIPWSVQYSVGRLATTDIAIAKSGGANGLMDLLTNENDAKVQALADATELSLWQSGYNEIGTIAAGGISSATITLTNRYDVHNFAAKGMKVQFASAVASGALRSSGATLTVSTWDVSTGKVTFTANVSTLSDVVPGDVAFRNGSRQDSATPSMSAPAGLAGWFPFSISSGESFYGIDRSTFARHLIAGTFFDARSSGNMLAAISDFNAELTVNGASPDTLFVHPTKWVSLQTDLLGKATTEVMSKKEGFGYAALEVPGPQGSMKCIAARSCPADRMYAIDTSTVHIVKVKGEELIHNPLYNGDAVLNLSSSDAVEMRNKAVWCVVVDNPRASGVARLA